MRSPYVGAHDERAPAVACWAPKRGSDGRRREGGAGWDLIASTTVAGLKSSLDSTSWRCNTLWVVVAAILVMFMQAGFAFLEMGFSRQKNAVRWSPRCSPTSPSARSSSSGRRVRLRIRRTAARSSRIMASPRIPPTRRSTFPACPSPTSALGEVVVRVCLLRGLAGGSFGGNDPRADQVQPPRYLRGRLLGDHLPADRPLAVLSGGWLAASLGSQDFAGFSLVH